MDFQFESFNLWPGNICKFLYVLLVQNGFTDCEHFWLGLSGILIVMEFL